MNFLLDTCVVSELIKREPHRCVITWLDESDEESLFLSVLTFGELEKGIARARDAMRKARLMKWVQRDLSERFAGRILPIDLPVAERWGVLVGASEMKGMPMPVIDSLLAATSLHHDLTLVTRNAADFDRCGARCFDPWSGTSGDT